MSLGMSLYVPFVRRGASTGRRLLSLFWGVRSAPVSHHTEWRRPNPLHATRSPKKPPYLGNEASYGQSEKKSSPQFKGCDSNGAVLARVRSKLQFFLAPAVRGRYDFNLVG